MSKQDYIAFAATIARQRAMCSSEEEQAVIDRVARAIADVLDRDSERFRRQQFLTACDYGEEFNPNRRS